MTTQPEERPLDLQQWSLDLARNLVDRGAADRRQMIDRWNDAPRLLRRELEPAVRETLQDDNEDEEPTDDPQQT